MTNDFYSTGIYEIDHTTFGGRIYNGDYDAHTTMSDIAARIISDMRFDKECSRNISGREWKKLYGKEF